MNGGLRKRIIAGNVLALLFLTVAVAGFALYTTRAFLEENARQEVAQRYESIGQMIDMYKGNALAHADGLAQNPLIIQAAKNRNTEALFEITAPILAKSRLDFLTITDSEGFIILRAHEPDKDLASHEQLINQVHIRQALQGNSFVGVEAEKEEKLSVRAGVPLHDPSGNLVGAISTGYILSNDATVDNAKKILGAEFTFFLGAKRIATTLTDTDGKRMIGTTLDNPVILQRVLKEGNTYHGFNRIGQVSHNTVYGPLVDANHEIIGMIFTGVSTATIDKILRELTMRILIISLIAFILMLSANIIFTRHITEPVQLVLEKVQEVVKLRKNKQTA